MTSWGAKKAHIWLILLLSAIAVAVAAGAVTAGVVESGKRTTVAASTFTKPSPPSTVQPTRQPTTPQRSNESSPSPTPEQSPRDVPAAVAPEVIQTLQAPVPLQKQAPTPAAKQCPTGPVTAQLVSVDIEKSDPSPSGSGLTEITVTGRGTLSNGTTSPISVGETDIPNFLGLDQRGQSIVIELYGTYDWAPPPGQPSMGEFVLNPGESVNYTAVSRNWDSTVKNVRYWYSANVSGSLLLYFPNKYVNCPVPVMKPAAGISIPNTFAG